VAGRSLELEDDGYDGPPPVVVSHVFWTSRLHQDPHAVGRTIRIGRTDATVVGVAERGFSVPNHRLLWLPLTAYGAVYGGSRPGAPRARTPEAGLEVFGRLLPDATQPEAEAQLSGIAAASSGASTAGDSAARVKLDASVGLGRAAASDTLATALFVFAVIALVVVLACTNVATVLVATAIAREREMGVRAALGASRARLVQQLVTESLVLGSIAALIGLVLTLWAMPAIASLIEAPAGSDLTPDLNVYLFLGMVTLVTAVAAGLAPAFHSRGADLLSPLKGDGARPDRLAPRRLRSALVMTQTAVSVLLIVLSTLFVRATFQAATIDVGFDAAGLYAVSPMIDDAIADDGAGSRAYWARAISELQMVPGVAGVSLVELAPFGGLTRTAITPTGPSEVITYFNRARADYFATVGLPVVAGRTFTPEEVAAGAPVALISQSVARLFWDGESPLGHRLAEQIPVPPSMKTGPGGQSLLASPRPVVIGIVGDAITERLHERNVFAVYEPLDPAAERFAQLMIRIAPGSSGVIQQASQRLRAIDPQADIRISSIAARLEQEASQPRTLATITGIVGVIAIVLCVIGLYGLTASLVAQRAREMGVRVAMGAEPSHLLRLLMWDSLRPVVFGLLAGSGAALLASRLITAAMFFGVSPNDLAALGGATAILLAAATVAVLVPTRRAAAVDAAFVLRSS
jgi:predicted permease